MSKLVDRLESGLTEGLVENGAGAAMIAALQGMLSVQASLTRKVSLAW